MKQLNLIRGIIILLLVVFNCSVQAQALLSFPGAEGFGRYAKGARGHASPSVYFVTTLADSGPGSFRDAVSQPGRFIIFKVGGIINLQSNLAIAANTTIAGHTAPGDGVVLYGRKVSFSGANETIARFLRLRLGVNAGAGKNDDASGISNGQNIILDHMSFTWGLDEVFSINWDNKGNEPDNITIQNSIIGQGLHRHNHSAGGLIQTSGKISIIKSLYHSNKTRNPKVKGINEFVNNVVYNFGNANTTYPDHAISADAYILGGESSGESNVIILNNYFVGGPSTPQSKSTPFSRGNGNFNLYEGGNYYDNNQNGQLDGTLIQPTDSWYPGLELSNFKTAADYSDYPSISPSMSATQAYQYLIDNVGATRPRRDEVDQFFVTELASKGTAGFYTYRESDLPLINGGLGRMDAAPLEDDTDSDGIPDSWEERLGLDKSNASDALQLSQDPQYSGYLNIEVYLNLLAGEQEDALVRPVTGLTATGESFETETPYSHVKLSWKNAQENTVVIERSSDQQTWLLLTTTAQNAVEYTDEQSLVPNTLYYYRLKAKNEEGESVYAQLSFRTPAIPTAPVATSQPAPAHQASSVTLNAGSLLLSWTGSDNTAYYEVFFGEDAANLSKISTGQLTARSLTIPSLTDDRTYYWRVDAINDKGIATGTVWSFKTEKIYPPQLIGHWKFDETLDEDQTVLIDQSTFHMNGELLHRPAEGANLRNNAGISGGAIDLAQADFSSYAASVPHGDHMLLNNSSFTMGLWMKAAAELKPGTNESAYIVCKGSITKNTETGATGNRFNIEVKGDALRFAIDNDALGKDELSTSSIPYYNGEWTYLTIVRDTENKKLKIYRNGQLDKEATITKALSGIGEASDLVLGNIGSLEFLKQGTTSAPYKGQLDEVKLFNYALTAEQIQAEYMGEMGLTAPHTPTPSSGAVSSKDSEMQVSWQGGEKATQFRVFKGTDATALSQVAELSTSVTSYLFEGLTAGTTYFWRVDAISGTETKSSEVWSFTTTAAKRELVGYYPFNNAANIGEDLSKYANHGTALDFPSTPYAESGKYNGSINYATGTVITTKRLEIPAKDNNLFDKNSFSVSFWMKGASNTYTASDVNSYIFHKGTFSNPGLWYGLQVSHNGNLVFAVDDNVTKTDVSANIATNTIFNNVWNHVVAVRDLESKSLVIYVNGVRVATKTNVITEAIGDASKPLVIGNSAENKSYRDQLDELKLYNYALSDEEVKNVYSQEVPAFKVVNVSPLNQAVDLDYKNVDLAWEGSEESYNVYVGESVDQLTLVQEDFLTNSYSLSGLSSGKVYYWRVDALRDGEAVRGDVWSFTTKFADRQLVGHYHFNNPDRIGEDASKYANHGTVYDFPATPYLASGKKGGAINYATDATLTTKRLEIPATEQNLFDQKSFSVSFWMKGASNTYTTSANNTYIFHKGTFSNPGLWYGLQVSHNGNLVFAIDDNVTKTDVSASIATNNIFNNSWNHFVAIRDADSQSILLYVNGVRAATKTGVITTVIGDASKPLVIGNSAENKSYRDQLDEFKLYNYALTDDEVKNVFQQEVPAFKATNPNPAHQSTGIEYPETVLSWEGEEDGYSLYVGNTADQMLHKQDFSEASSYTMSGMEGQTTYYWRVDAIRDGEVAKGDVWSFQTASKDREKPLIQDLALSVREDVALGALLGQVHADVITGGVLENWRIVRFDDPNGNGVSPLRIDPVDGTLYVEDREDFDHLLGNTFTFDVQVANGDNWSDSTTLSIHILAVNTAPSFELPSSLAICNTGEEQEFLITNVNPGRESEQKVKITLSTVQPFLFNLLELDSVSATERRVRYRLMDNVQGLVKFVIKAQDNGGVQNDGVDSYSTDLILNVNSLPTVHISKNGRPRTMAGKEVTLSLEEAFPANYSYKWYKDSQLIGEQAFVVVQAQQDALYSVEVSSPLGCTVMASTKLTAITSDEDIAIKVGNLLTPNHDGVNDVWMIENLELFNENEVFIYNQSGQLLFQKRNYLNDWNGTTSGNRLATGVYLYRVVVDGQQYSGTLNIVN
ncbi:LamG-like jellyroll fold domain-containing protein [Sphingobacterium sp. LRF_L2]|uniref:LamG-like jellyroll fold domain-containing protein n=1 Tax=Sphingobacterium sp. LRF_L2 TaxID=3369421 RepID=UPI003F63C6CA